MATTFLKKKGNDPIEDILTKGMAETAEGVGTPAVGAEAVGTDDSIGVSAVDVVKPDGGEVVKPVGDAAGTVVAETDGEEKEIQPRTAEYGSALDWYTSLFPVDEKAVARKERAARIANGVLGAGKLLSSIGNLYAVKKNGAQSISVPDVQRADIDAFRAKVEARRSAYDEAKMKLREQTRKEKKDDYTYIYQMKNAEYKEVMAEIQKRKIDIVELNSQYQNEVNAANKDKIKSQIDINKAQLKVLEADAEKAKATAEAALMQARTAQGRLAETVRSNKERERIADDRNKNEATRNAIYAQANGVELENWTDIYGY